ncbi:tetratricopeptide repeat protein [Cohaesibacter haloalkalitolerans]|uniref:tetratricopeptide repeat protein n=1 Tax=Cohaesibacter haloalkalitolerans TaxID=1162980 RepID=UPI000E64E8AA|nr:SEL1-like repeat protein [Cohaesibacter haloalkalitolerans]
MRNSGYGLGKLLPGIIVGTAIGLLASTSARAVPVAVHFAPPTIELGKICEARRPDAQIIESWRDWDGKVLPKGRSAEESFRELVRLQYIDAKTFYSKILAGLKLQKAADPYYDEARYLVDLIQLHMQAGKFQEIKEQKLIEQLEKVSGSSAKAQNYLANLHLQGMHPNSDPAKAIELKIQAAYDGEPDAMLYLAQRTAGGEKIEGWDVAPDIAATLAFGAILGKLNPSICDRTVRLAREYANGDIVQRNYELSDAWYRFGADLGDDFSAWKSAEYHLTSEYITKNNDYLVKYLKQASDGGILNAQLEYARALEIGAIVDENKKEAMAIYQKIARKNPRLGYLRLVQLLDSEHRTTPQAAKQFKDALLKLSELDDAPGWVFAKLGQAELEEKGKWLGMTAAKGYFEKGARKGDAESQYQLGRLLMHDNDDPSNYERAIDLFNETISSDGKVASLTALLRAHSCFSRRQNDAEIAGFWQRAEQGAGNSSLDVTLDSLRLAAVGESDQSRAIQSRIQNTALYGRTKALQNYAILMSAQLDAASDAAEADLLRQKISFWRGFAKQFEGGEASFVAGLYMAATTSEDKGHFLGDLQDLVAQNDDAAKLKLAGIYLEKQADDASKVKEAQQLILTSSDKIPEDLLQAFLDARTAHGMETKAFVAQNLDNLAKRASAQSLLILASVETDGELQRDLFNKSVVQMGCDFDTSFKMVEFLRKTYGHTDVFKHWLGVASRLHSEPWQSVKLGDLYAEQDSKEARAKAYDLYMEAVKAQDNVAAIRLLDWVADPESEFYNATLAVNLFNQAIETARPSLSFGIANRVKRAPEPIREAVLENNSLEKLYRSSAKASNPVAMRELAKILRSGEPNDSRLEEASNWLKQAAEQRDVEAMAMLAQNYAFGIGVTPSAELAQKWLRAAAEAGDKTSASLLALSENQNKGQ